MEPLTNYKVTEQEIKEKGVQAVQGEVLYGEPSENKLIFDRLVTFFIGKYNQAMDWLVDKAHIHSNKAILDTITSQTNVHEHENKALLDTITKTANVHEHANKDLLDTIQLDNVHAHANKAVLDTIAEANVHLHENKALIDLIDSREQIHSHLNKAFLDSLRETDIHSHENKAVLDTITQNLIAKWNQSAGVEDGSTDMDYGSFTGTHSKLQIRRGAAADLPELSEGEFGLAGSTVHIGTPEGNRALADKEAVEEAIEAIDLTPYAEKAAVTTAISGVNQAIEAGKDLLFTNVLVPVSAWVATSEYTYSKFKTTVALTGVTAAMDVEVFFAPNDADSGILSGSGIVSDGSITLLAVKKPEAAITIPKVRCMR